MFGRALLAVSVIGLLGQIGFPSCVSFEVRPVSEPARSRSLFPQKPLMAATVPGKKKGYEPKWKKKKTLADEMENGDGPKDFSKVGIKGTIPVVFKQGNQTKSTLAFPGQPLRDVATQAGQFIKYGCGKGECGTCEALVDGKWIRPCSVAVPALSAGQEYAVMVKEIKSKAKSSGKFYSIRSFLMGFWNNLLGMIGFLRYRRNAKQNWNERKEYEDLIRQKTLEKKAARANELGGDLGTAKP